MSATFVTNRPIRNAAFLVALISDKLRNDNHSHADTVSEEDHTKVHFY